MISVIIDTANDEVGLAQLLAALVPSATEGVVNDVIIVDHGSTDGTEIVADAAGCTIVRARAGSESEATAAAVSAARGEWLLFLPPRPDALAAGWQREALAFIDRVMVAGTAHVRSATFHEGRIPNGAIAVLRALLGRRSRSQLIAKSAWRLRALPAPSASSASGVRRAGA